MTPLSYVTCTVTPEMSTPEVFSALAADCLAYSRVRGTMPEEIRLDPESYALVCRAARGPLLDPRNDTQIRFMGAQVVEVFPGYGGLSHRELEIAKIAWSDGYGMGQAHALDGVHKPPELNDFRWLKVQIDHGFYAKIPPAPGGPMTPIRPESRVSQLAGLLSQPFWLQWHAKAGEWGVWSRGMFQFYRRNSWGWWIPYGGTTEPPRVMDGRL